MMPFLAWLEGTALGTWVRESGTIWAYPTILFLHTVGLGLVVGLSATIALRILGVARQAALAPMERFYRILWIGFAVNAASGVLLLVADATTKFLNPVFWIKMGFVFGAMGVMVWIRRAAFHRPAGEGEGLAAKPRVLAVVVLILWAGAITAGRLMAYFGPVSGAPDLTNSLGR